MRLLAKNHLEVLFDTLTWRDNPFIRRDARRDAKRKQPWKSLLWMCGTLLVLGGLGVWGMNWALGQNRGFPWFLGGDIGTAFCILLCGIHVWFVMGAAQKPTLTLLAQEVSHNTFPYLLMLPLPTFQWLIQSAVYPWLSAMRVAVLLLPLYALCVGLGGISWGDLVMLYFVFAMLAVSIPAWRKPARSDTVASGVAQTTPTTQNTNTLGTFGAAQQQQNAATTQGTAGTSGGGWTAFLFVPMFFGMIIAFGGGRNAGSLYFAVKRYIPDDILLLMPSSILSWPLIIARSLVTGFDWFGIPLWPLPFVLVGFLISRYTQVVRSTEFLQVGAYRDLPEVETYRPRRRLESALRIGQAFVFTGYIWKWVVWDGGIGRIVATIPNSAAPGLTAFAYLLLFFTIARLLIRAGSVGRWYIPPRKVTKESVVAQIPLPSLVRFLGEPLLFALVFFFVCCLVARTNPFVPQVVELAGQMLAIGCAGALLGIVANRALGFLAWFGATIYFIVTMGPDWTKPLMYLSPALGLLRLGGATLARIGGNTANQPLDWWRWPLWMGALTLALAPVALFWAWRARKRQGELQTMTIDPTQVGFEVFMDASFAQNTTNKQTDSPVARRLITGLQRIYDNAVTIKEMRGGLRGKLLPQSLRSTFLTYFVVTISIVQGIPSLAEAFGGSIAQMLYGGKMPNAGLQALADTQACWYWIMVFVAFGVGSNTFAAFSTERDKSTLGFLLMTPLSIWQILIGKLSGLLLAQGAALLTLGAWTLFLSLALTGATGSLMPLLSWGGVMLVLLAVALTLGSLGLAFSALFPRALSASVRGWVWFIVVQVLVQSRSLFAWFWELLSDIGIKFGPDWMMPVVSFVLFQALMIGLAYWGVYRMRKGDIAFASSKREN